MCMMTEYELIVIYDKEYGEVIVFKSNHIMNDSNDIVSEAIKLQLLDERYRSKVRIARGLLEFEYDYIKKKEV